MNEREALAELVALHDLKGEESRLRQRRECSILRQPNKLREADAMRAEYNRRVPLAWAAARAVLAQPEPDPVARLLHWVGPSPRPGAECIARTFAEYPVGTDGNRAYWSEGAQLYAAPPAPAQPALSDEEMADCGLLSELKVQP